MGLDRWNVTIGDQREKAEPKKPNEETEASGKRLRRRESEPVTKRALWKSTRDGLYDDTCN
jgi:hypothetical protein